MKREYTKVAMHLDVVGSLVPVITFLQIYWRASMLSMP